MSSETDRGGGGASSILLILSIVFNIYLGVDYHALLRYGGGVECCRCVVAVAKLVMVDV